MISIVVTNHNYARFLDEAIESALGQAGCECETIVVDDGSTDNSREVILKYGDRIIPFLQSNGGQASAFNAGFNACHGSAVIFLDADDILLPDTARQVARVFESRRDVAKVQYRMKVIDEQGKETGIKPAEHLALSSGDLTQYVISFPDDMTWMATSGNAFATAVLRQIFPMPESAYGSVAADWYVSHLTPLFGQVVSLDHVGACYRVHGSNSYELSSPGIDLEHIRQTIMSSRTTHAHIAKYARQLGLDPKTDRQGDLYSVSYIANRLISLRLDARRHPIPTDTVGSLFLLGLRAARQRFDISPVMRGMFMLWFALVAIMPKRVVRWLAVKFFFPETRGSINRWLGALHRTP